jgi:hypothetical protein
MARSVDCFSELPPSNNNFTVLVHYKTDISMISSNSNLFSLCVKNLMYRLLFRRLLVKLLLPLLCKRILIFACIRTSISLIVLSCIVFRSGQTNWFVYTIMVVKASLIIVGTKVCTSSFWHVIRFLVLLYVKCPREVDINQPELISPSLYNMFITPYICIYYIVLSSPSK